MSTNQLPNGAISGPPVGEPVPAQSAPGFPSTAASDPGLLDARELDTNQTFAANSSARGRSHTSIDSTHGRVGFDSPSNPGAGVPGAIRTGTWRVEEDGRLVENMLVPIPDEEPGRINTTGVLDIHPDSRGNNYLHGGDNTNQFVYEIGDPELMRYEGEEYYEETDRYRPNASSSIFFPLPPAPLATISAGLAASAATGAREHPGNMDRTRTQTWNMPPDEVDDGDPSFTIFDRTRVVRPTVRSSPRAPTFRNAAGEIDINLIPHAPRTDLPPPPPLIPLPRLTEAPPATWFEGMSEGSKCPVLSQPDYVVEYSFPCGHALCRWCYEQICLASDRPVCRLCRRRI
ncbi:hypothetical protein C7212DRAFT_365183 [Tuber magnatum]|uniref:RING-type domain-containing protein n=1 Tax=Tuber magnatum TaxID=42249 RepID=A0A317SKE8_9PEZI|nr:hypothetical protein C7212DRAFT_365183 [Tuber magnatum]